MTLPEAQNTNGARSCPRCDSSFTCGIAAGEEHCWCFDLPRVAPLTHANTEGCLCRDCLRAHIISLQTEAQDSAE